ncbi:uncharacterized protein K452DRAFT_275283 [Aplosporella prunicola CBS 121167]|uniref:OPT superfamily oligopeptide transporter n=1 Tax=Aplosporella prunicola CBS 121167 TaxID=1176127 RepID=A0A6A6B6M5_9PEZI|nr:uncharacterized protein K452DRAFT_275283 [Aplosporella prunicola CBS 121167]KAF2139769.1 hypothetical protein K452DRAFT_275283 [Aplosporella prunicola CBS 121167]
MANLSTQLPSRPSSLSPPRSRAAQEQNAQFTPFEDLADEPDNVLTVRAVLVGIACGALINASNIYVGLKSGWTASANIFASIVGFTVLKFCSKHLSPIALIGSPFGPRENNIVQTAATAAGGMSNVFISAFPAMYQLGLLESPQQDYWRIASLTAVGGYFGLFLATPLRAFFIKSVGRELGLVFPSSSATAATIRGMHMGSTGQVAAKRKTRVLAVVFSVSAGLRVVSEYAIGILWDWHISTWLFESGLSKEFTLALESWGWFLEWSPAFIGSGMLVGCNVAFSYLLGTVIAWGIIGPLLVARGIGFGVAQSSDPRWSGYVSYGMLSEDFTTADHPSPRYWLLWPGVSCMIAVACTDLLCQWRTFWLTGHAMYRSLASRVSYPKLLPHLKGWTRIPGSVEEKEVAPKKENYLQEEEVLEASMWAPGLLLTVVLTCIVMQKQFGVEIGQTLLALFLSSIFSFIAIQASGATDVTPLTAVTKASQIIIGADTKGQGLTMQQAQHVNLLGGALANIGANQAADLVGDFRVGFLLRTAPKTQWLAQSLGTAVAVLLAPAIYILFATAYPCIHATADNCAFHAPSVAAWRAVAVAVTDPAFAIPASSARFSVALAAFGCTSTLVRQFAWTGSRAWLRAWHPNMMVVALPFVIPTTVVGSAMAVGACAAALWARRSPASHAEFAHSVAAGMMAGEGIGGVLSAVIHVMGLSGDLYGTTWGCPAGMC